mgnify:CR=1 FL=1
MSVRQSLLAILDQGPCYGYQLRAEFDRRTGSTWPLNVGQIYNTLERLERDGLVAKGDVDEQGHVYYRITDAGSAEVRTWLGTPVARAAGTRDELPIKLALAATLPGVDVGEIVQTQRRASLAALDQLRQAATSSSDADSSGADSSDADGEALAGQLVADAAIFRAEAEVRWLDHVEATLRTRAAHTRELELNADRPRRGRPPRAPLTADLVAG